MVILSKGCKPDNIESNNSIKLKFTNICGLCLNFVEYESFVEPNCSDILALCKTNLDDLIAVLKITASRWSLTIVTGFVTAEKLR